MVDTTTTIDPRSGFCPSTRTFHSIRPHVALPPPSEPLSVTSFSLSLLRSLSLPPSHPLFIDASSATSLPIHLFLSRLRSLSSALRSPPFNLSKGRVAFILSPSRLEVPLLYLSLLSLGVAVCPSNPACTPCEISRQLRLTSPSIAFVTSVTAHLLPEEIPTVLLDSPSFQSIFCDGHGDNELPEVHQDDTAVILFSSGTTGPPKAAAASHRNYIAMIAGFFEERRLRSGVAVRNEAMLLTAPMFHSLGFFFAVKGVALGETVVVMDRPRLGDMLSAAEQYGVGTMTAAPPVIVAMGRWEGVADLRRLRSVICGGAPVKAAEAERFKRKFPWVALQQGFGMTEGGSIAQLAVEECENHNSVGKLHANIEAIVVDPVTEETLEINQKGELRLRGPTVMKGYLGDDDATASSFGSDGWLKTGDLCYFDEDGYLYIVDRLKELIKYKAYQVAPAELEELLVSHADIIDAAVVPYPQEEWGEIPLAFVVTQPGSAISETQIMEFVAKEVAPYKKIRKVEFVDTIPRNPSGKILRRELVSRALCVKASE